VEFGPFPILLIFAALVLVLLIIAVRAGR